MKKLPERFAGFRAARPCARAYLVRLDERFDLLSRRRSARTVVEPNINRPVDPQRAAVETRPPSGATSNALQELLRHECDLLRRVVDAHGQNEACAGRHAFGAINRPIPLATQLPFDAPLGRGRNHRTKITAARDIAANLPPEVIATFQPVQDAVRRRNSPRRRRRAVAAAHLLKEKHQARVAWGARIASVSPTSRGSESRRRFASRRNSRVSQSEIHRRAAAGGCDPVRRKAFRARSAGSAARRRTRVHHRWEITYVGDALSRPRRWYTKGRWSSSRSVGRWTSLPGVYAAAS